MTSTALLSPLVPSQLLHPVNHPSTTAATLTGYGLLSQAITNNAEYVGSELVNRNYDDTNYILLPEYARDSGQASSKTGTSNYTMTGDVHVHRSVNVSGQASVMNKVRAQNVYMTSDARLKTDIQPLSGCLRKSLDLRAFSYSRSDWERLDNVSENDRFIGLLAQEVRRIFPDLVRVDEQDGFMSIDYQALLAVLIEAVKEMAHEWQSSRVPVY